MQIKFALSTLYFYIRTYTSRLLYFFIFVVLATGMLPTDTVSIWTVSDLCCYQQNKILKCFKNAPKFSMKKLKRGEVQVAVTAAPKPHPCGALKLSVQ